MAVLLCLELLVDLAMASYWTFTFLIARSRHTYLTLGFTASEVYVDGFLYVIILGHH